ncbi:GNAT family N-acetyltransferase [Streptacidiphilus jiangxiensis]|uniref:Acetyltransferase (GNAT) domain-containing protein n=1 Tax=Streptacidiphilus jiangxiensis TaxID=235985 RepID=A0A1H7RYU5_STRJI|nr:GNAT family N-acetyltransferase [Streptacidiphilus jiangxiensis]SEL65450.1 Acetyltransferase (GNAT) domain-containing protein [Streptacidiphilus jiangxiensis]
MLLTTPRLRLCLAPPPFDPSGFDWVPEAPGAGVWELAGIAARAAEVGWYVPPWGMYVIVRSGDDRALGGIGFHGPPTVTGEVELGYELAPAARGAGYATEAVTALAALALEDPEVRAVTARTAPANEASQAVLIRAGFTRVPVPPADGMVHFRRTA